MQACALIITLHMQACVLIPPAHAGMRPYYHPEPQGRRGRFPFRCFAAIPSVGRKRPPEYPFLHATICGICRYSLGRRIQKKCSLGVPARSPSRQKSPKMLVECMSHVTQQAFVVINNVSSASFRLPVAGCRLSHSRCRGRREGHPRGHRVHRRENRILAGHDHQTRHREPDKLRKEARPAPPPLKITLCYNNYEVSLPHEREMLIYECRFDF